MSTSRPLTVRSLGPEGLESMLRTVDAAFGDLSAPEAITSWSRVLERDRTFTIHDGDALVGGGSIYTFRLSVPGGALPAGGLTAVGVLPTHRRRGALRSMMRRVLDDGIARREPLSVLWAAEGPIYGRYGYGIAAMRGTITAPRHQIEFAPPLTDRGRVRLLTPEEALRLLPPVWERAAAITPGVFSRTHEWWSSQVLDDAEWRRGGAGVRFIPALEVDGRIEGYAFYRMRTEWDHLGPHNTLEVRELVAPDPAAELALWRFLFEMDLVSTVKAFTVPLDTPLLLRTTDPRRLAMTVGDALWLRILDVPAALSGRTWAADGALTLDVADELLPAMAGRWRLTVTGGHATVERTAAHPDAILGIAELSSLFLGGIRAADLARAGRIEAPDPATIGLLDAMHATARRPWCPAVF
jgi:predicted acetyltransferase